MGSEQENMPMKAHHIVACWFQRTKDSPKEQGTAFLRSHGLYDVLLFVDADCKPVPWDEEGCIWKYGLQFEIGTINIPLE